MSNRKERVREAMARLESPASEGAEAATGEAELKELQAGLREDAGESNAEEVTRRLESASVGMIETPEVPASEAAAAPAAVTPANDAPKRKGGWPKGKPRNGAKAASKPAKSAKTAPKVTAVRESTGGARTFASRETLAQQAQAAEAKAAELEKQLAAGSGVSDEEIADLQYEIEGILITCQAVGRQKLGRHALLTEEQSLAIQRMWTRPFERALRFLAKRSDDGRLPMWVLPAVQLSLALVGTVAVLFPNWMAYVDEQQAAAKVNQAANVEHVVTEAEPGAGIGQAAELHELEFMRPRGADV